MDRPQLTEEDVLILLSRPAGAISPAAGSAAGGVGTGPQGGRGRLRRKRCRRAFSANRGARSCNGWRERVENFARCGSQRIDEWVDQFRLERRTTLARAAVILAVPEESWKRPPGQEYVSQLLGFFRKAHQRLGVARRAGADDDNEDESAARPDGAREREGKGRTASGAHP